ncbi:MAG: hypothetical protein KKE20_04120 [Nanoarchaeota archaeon]|nr:hypothetical protein [Nanoarchaeota archaeon]
MDKKGQYEWLIKMLIIIIGGAIIILFLFYNSLPAAVKVMERLGIIDSAELLENQDPPETVQKVEATSEEGIKAVAAFRAVRDAIKDCRAKTGEKCLCPMNVPEFEEGYPIALMSSVDRSYFIMYVFKSAYDNANIPTTAILDNYKFEGMELCSAGRVDNVDNAAQLEILEDIRFHLYRDDNKELWFTYIPQKAFHEDTYPVVGLPADIADPARKNTNFQLLKYDKDHVCLIVGRDDNDPYAWTAEEDADDYAAEMVKILSPCS